MLTLLGQDSAELGSWSEGLVLAFDGCVITLVWFDVKQLLKIFYPLTNALKLKEALQMLKLKIV